MKAQFILLILLLSVIGSSAYATETEPKEKEKKTKKSKYDFNIFRLYSITIEQQRPDSLKLEALPKKRKED